MFRLIFCCNQVWCKLKITSLKNFEWIFFYSWRWQYLTGHFRELYWFWFFFFNPLNFLALLYNISALKCLALFSDVILIRKLRHLWTFSSTFFKFSESLRVFLCATVASWFSYLLKWYWYLKVLINNAVQTQRLPCPQRAFESMPSGSSLITSIAGKFEKYNSKIWKTKLFSLGKGLADHFWT